MIEKKIGNGKIRTFRRVLFKQRNTISKDPITPIFISELEIIQPFKGINDHKNPYGVRIL